MLEVFFCLLSLSNSFKGSTPVVTVPTKEEVIVTDLFFAPPTGFASSVPSSELKPPKPGIISNLTLDLPSPTIPPTTRRPTKTNTLTQPIQEIVPLEQLSDKDISTKVEQKLDTEPESEALLTPITEFQRERDEHQAREGATSTHGEEAKGGLAIEPISQTGNQLASRAEAGALVSNESELGIGAPIAETPTQEMALNGTSNTIEETNQTETPTEVSYDVLDRTVPELPIKEIPNGAPSETASTEASTQIEPTVAVKNTIESSPDPPEILKKSHSGKRKKSAPLARSRSSK